jgi:hypothetical protein
MRENGITLEEIGKLKYTHVIMKGCTFKDCYYASYCHNRKIPIDKSDFWGQLTGEEDRFFRLNIRFMIPSLITTPTLMNLSPTQCRGVQKLCYCQLDVDDYTLLSEASTAYEIEE